MTKAEIKKRNHELFVRGCLRKVKYFSERSARHAIRAQAVHGIPRHRFYKCRFCNTYHLTHLGVSETEGMTK